VLEEVGEARPAARLLTRADPVEDGEAEDRGRTVGGDDDPEAVPEGAAPEVQVELHRVIRAADRPSIRLSVLPAAREEERRIRNGGAAAR
jgi:hypothetical protein